MIDKKYTSLPISFSVDEELSNEDTRFIKVKIDILHTGKNFNDSIFEKKVVEANIETIKNTPILGFIRELPNGEKDFKGHEYILTKTDKDGIKRKYIGTAYGLIPESCSPRWYSKVCQDGIEREFLQVDGLLWSKFTDSSEIMLRDISKSQSMELQPSSIEGYENEDGDFVFTKFSFDGATILGEGIEPAMIDSTIEVQFSVSDFVANLQSELNDKYKAFTELVNEKNNQGGIGTMSNTNFAQTLMEQFSDISAMVSQAETIQDRWGDTVQRYYLQDIQDNEVIVVDRKNSYQYYGFPFTMSGDKANIDFACGKRKKTQYVDYAENESVPEGAFDFGKQIESIEEKSFSKIEEANQKVTEVETKLSETETNYANINTDYEAIKAKYEEIEPKYNEYVNKEETRIAEEISAQKDAEFAKFSETLADNAEFLSLKDKKEELSVDEINTKCSILFTRIMLANKTNFSKSDNQLKAGIIEENSDNEGYATTKYGNIPVRK